MLMGVLEPPPEYLWVIHLCHTISRIPTHLIQRKSLEEELQEYPRRALASTWRHQPPFGRLWDWLPGPAYFRALASFASASKKTWLARGCSEVLLKIPISHPSWAWRCLCTCAKPSECFQALVTAILFIPEIPIPKKNISGKKMNHSKFVICVFIAGHRGSNV